MSLGRRECQRFVEEVTAVMERAAPVEVVAWFEDHLDQCRKCVEYLEQMHETSRLLAATLDHGPGSATPQLWELLDEVRELGDAPG